LNRYLRRTIEIDTVVSDDEAVTYCKLGPLILIGLIHYPNLRHWQNTKIHKVGLLNRQTPLPLRSIEITFSRDAVALRN
jgi:hypothetical protein